MAKERIYIPASRIVSGSPSFKQEKDYYGKPLDRPRWFLAIALPKNDPRSSAILQQIMNVAWNGYQGNAAVQARIQQWLNGDFHFKIEDGDNPKDPKARGREGYAGCWILKLSTSLGAPMCCTASNIQMDPALIKTGHYVDAQISVEENGLTDGNAGVYLNPDCIRFLGYGQEIATGPTPEQMFAGIPAEVPAGASAQPVPPNAQPGAGFPQVGGPGAAPGFHPGSQHSAGGPAVPTTGGPGYPATGQAAQGAPVIQTPAGSAGPAGYPTTASPSSQPPLYPGFGRPN